MSPNLLAYTAVNQPNIQNPVSYHSRYLSEGVGLRAMITCESQAHDRPWHSQPNDLFWNGSTAVALTTIFLILKTSRQPKLIKLGRDPFRLWCRCGLRAVNLFCFQCDAFILRTLSSDVNVHRGWYGLQSTGRFLVVPSETEIHQSKHVFVVAHHKSQHLTTLINTMACQCSPSTVMLKLISMVINGWQNVSCRQSGWPSAVLRQYRVLGLPVYISRTWRSGAPAWVGNISMNSAYQSASPATSDLAQQFLNQILWRGSSFPWFSVRMFWAR